MIAIILVVLGFVGIGHSRLNSHEVDLLEINHVVDDGGKEVFCQLVLWRFSDVTNRLEVTDWISMKEDKLIRVNRYGENWVATFRCEKKNFKIVSRSFSETWGFDSEIANRESLPEEMRARLLR